jgi:hypothetical protein
MNQLLNGSLDLTMILEKAKAKHSAFSKSTKNGHIYFNITQWINDEPNEFGQHSSLLLNSSKEGKETEGKVYIGNAKKVEGGGNQEPLKDDTVTELPEIDSLPF